MSKWKIAWVTGASKGIGRSVALELAAKGVTVAASARSEDKLQALAQEARDLPGDIHPYPLDITDQEKNSETVQRIENDLGPIDLAILNAGTHAPMKGAKFSTEPFRKLMEINFMGTVNGLAPLIDVMGGRGRGRIGIVASVAGYRGLPTAAPYCASKSALITMAESLKPSLDKKGVILSLINPGFVRTPLTDKNEFKMPFLMEPEAAARRIVRGLERDKFEITFPRRFTYWLKLGRILPYWLYFLLMRPMVRD